MKTYTVNLSSPIVKDFYTQQAANSVDIDLDKPYTHKLQIDADLDGNYNILLIQGSSGAGKSTLAKSLFGVTKEYLNITRAVISQFPQGMPYEDRVNYLTSAGISSVPQWICPAFILSTGQKARAEIALALAHTKENEVLVLDEFTSVLDRSIAKILSHTVQRFIRKFNRKVCIVSCHRDLVEFLDPDLIIDCDTMAFIDRRLLSREERTRKEKLNFEIRKVDKRTWESFSQYHYLSNKLPGGAVFCYGLFYEGNQIGIHVLANYIPIREHQLPIYHGARIVIRPDFVGMGLGLVLVNESVKHFVTQIKCEVRTTSSSVPMYKAMLKDPHWKFLEKKNVFGKAPSTKMRKYGIDKKTFSRLNKPDSFRKDVVQYRFTWKG